jgi:PAS domain S-box-containing protein
MQPLTASVTAAAFVEELFDHIADTVYFVKDTAGRYAAVNQTLVARCGLAAKAELLGRTAREVFPEPLGQRYLEQDLQVCTSGEPLTDLLELHLYPAGGEGWCMTDKVPVRDADSAIIGLVGVSRDLRAPGDDAGFAELSQAVAHLREHFAEPLRVEDMALAAGLSPYQLNRRLRAVFGLTAGQLLAKTRIDAATHLLRDTELPVAEIAIRCGYCDQSAFSRQFRAAAGLTPGQYRSRSTTGS